eukprot:ctg_1908.g347
MADLVLQQLREGAAMADLASTLSLDEASRAAGGDLLQRGAQRGLPDADLSRVSRGARGGRRVQAGADCAQGALRAAAATRLHRAPPPPPPPELGRLGAHGWRVGALRLRTHGRPARRRPGAAEHVLHPRPRRAEGVQLSGAIRQSQGQHPPRPEAGGGRLCGPAGGRNAVAALSGARPGVGPAVRQPAGGPAGGCGERQPGGGHRAHPHHGGCVAATAGVANLCLGEHLLRLQRALHLLCGAVHPRPGAVAQRGGDLPRGGAAQSARVPRRDPARPEHRRVRAGHATAGHFRAAAVPGGRHRHRPHPRHHCASALLVAAGDPGHRRTAKRDAVLSHPFPGGRRRRAAGDEARIHRRPLSAHRGHDPGAPAGCGRHGGRHRGISGRDRGAVPAHAAVDARPAIGQCEHGGVLAATAHAGGHVGGAGARRGEGGPAAAHQRGEYGVRGRAQPSVSGARGGGAGGGCEPARPGAGRLRPHPHQQESVLRCARRCRALARSHGQRAHHRHARFQSDRSVGGRLSAGLLSVG